jgi:hypothetical protein
VGVPLSDGAGGVSPGGTSFTFSDLGAEEDEQAMMEDMARMDMTEKVRIVFFRLGLSQ